MHKESNEMATVNMPKIIPQAKMVNYLAQLETVVTPLLYIPVSFLKRKAWLLSFCGIEMCLFLLSVSFVTALHIWIQVA